MLMSMPFRLTFCQINFNLHAGGQGAHAAVDAVAGDEFNQILAATRYGGTVFSYGCLSGKPCQVDALKLLYNVKKVEVSPI